MKKILNPLNALVVLGLLSGVASAQGSQPLTVKLEAFQVKTVQEGGKTVEKLVPSTKTLPGDVIVYQLNFTNNLTSPITGLVQPFAVPVKTSFISQECTLPGVRADFTIDEREVDKQGLVTNLDKLKYAAAPLKKTVTVTENGKKVQKTVEVKPNEYTALRWSFPPVPAKQTVSCSMRIKVG